MKILVQTALLALSLLSVANGEMLSCFTVNAVLFEESGKTMESTVYGEKDKRHAENWMILDLDSSTSTYFWSDDKGNKSSTTERLNKVNKQLYYAKVDEESDIGYSAYLFEEDLRRGILTEDGYTSFLFVKDFQ